jgi:magnesium chelatase subunit ChlD-like protein
MSHRGSRAGSGSSLPRWQPPPSAPRPLTIGPGHQPLPALDWPATLCAKRRAPLAREHWRHRQVPARPADLHLVLLDTSGSMQRQDRLARAKGWALGLIERAAHRGDDVALLCFGGQGVHELLAPQPARRALAPRVRVVGGGGGTPLPAALREAATLLRRRARRHGAGAAALWLLTDGRCDAPPQQPAAVQVLHIVDFDDPLAPAGRCSEWAAQWQARRWLP